MIPVNLSESLVFCKRLTNIGRIGHTLARHKHGWANHCRCHCSHNTASATTSELILAHEVHTASFVNHLAKNVTNALSI